MMTIGEVIELIKSIFALLMQYLAPLFKKEEDGTEESTTQA